MTELSLAGRVDAFRSLRAQAEASVLPLATSLDGRRFSFQARIEGLELQLGGYVMLEGDGGATLGQVRTLAVAEADLGDVGLAGDDEADVRTRLTIRLARGDGVILDRDAAPFHDHLARAATEEEVRAWQAEVAPRAGEPGGREPVARGRRADGASTPAASTATRSCAGSRARARATRSASCSSSCCSRRTCGS